MSIPEPTLTEILNILQSLREEIASLKGGEKTRVICEGVTGKGIACRNRACPESKFCKMHAETKQHPEKKEKKKREKKEVKPKKIQPEHTHGIGEVPSEPCPLCMTHGDVLNANLPNATFDSDDITERLRKLIEFEEDS
tara:strand:+ start:3295 stop:3711 length:417 start_codon:yes stop_codon:yes gene_type:complete